MIVYFADRHFEILGHASTQLLEGITISYDRKIEDVETGVATFELTINYTDETRADVEKFTSPGNYILRSFDNENELYTIIDRERKTKKKEITIYAEDDGLDLLNEIVGPYEAAEAYPIAHYINMYAAAAGFEIGINEASSLTRKLLWDSESTAAERIASVATQFDGCEISYSFDVKGLFVVKKYINIYKKRGKDIGTTLYLNKDIDNIIVNESIANLATALRCEGGTPDSVKDEDTGKMIEQPPITLAGYKYDDGDFYTDGELLKSRKAFDNWSRFLWKTNDSSKSGGHVVKRFSYDTLEQSELCAHAITKLKKLREMEVNYECDITKLPEDAKIGDRINVVDDAGELYLSTRILQLKYSELDNENKATLGEYLLKDSGIHLKVSQLAELFAQQAKTTKRAIFIANTANETAATANNTVFVVQEAANNAQNTAQQAQQAATTAEQLAYSAQDEAKQAAQAAKDAADTTSATFDRTTENITEVNGDLQSLKDTINKHFEFADDSLTLTAGENTMSITLENNVVSYTKNGQQFGFHDGVNYHIGNTLIEVNQRSQIGNFAFVPRSNGSLDLLKVADI